MVHNAPRVLRVYGLFMAAVGLLASIVLLLRVTGIVSLPAEGRAGVYIAQARALGPGSVLMCCVALAGILGSLRVLAKGSGAQVVQWTLLDTVMVYWMFSAAIQPMVLNPKSDRPMAAAVEALVPADEPVYGFMSADMLRYYTAGFYLDDRITAVTAPGQRLARRGWILAGDADADSLRRFMPGEASLTPMMEWPVKSCDNKLLTTIYFYEIPEN